MLTFNKWFCLLSGQMMILSGYTQETSAFVKHLQLSMKEKKKKKKSQTVAVTFFWQKH